MISFETFTIMLGFAGSEDGAECVDEIKLIQRLLGEYTVCWANTRFVGLVQGLLGRYTVCWANTRFVGLITGFVGMIQGLFG